jgi:DNA-directed RNA polymerase specialized sigma24 family protein
MDQSRCRSGANTAHSDEKKTNIEAVLSQYDPYLIKQVHDCMRLHPDVVHPELLDLERDELVQRVRIKFWHALEDKHIDYPKTYIKRIVNSEFIDLVRRIKPHYALDLPVDEEGELYQGHMLITPSVGMADPAVEYEEKVTVSERMQTVVDAVLALPARQQHALICDMRDRVDDLEALTKAFKVRKANIEGWQWPQQSRERLLLRASLTYARLKVSTQMKETKETKEAGRSDGYTIPYKNRRVIC